MVTLPAGPGAPGEPPPIVLVEATRRHVLHPERPHVVESRHLGHAVVVAPDGSCPLVLGDADRLTFVRSCAKPFQTTACVEALRDHGVPVPDDDELAVSWASHRGEPAQLAAVARLLQRSGRDATQLSCPPARSRHDPGGVRRRLNHNCSGKHALFALAGDAVGCPSSRLLDPTGPLQRRVLGVLREAFGTADVVSVDGCGAPAIAAPLRGIAAAFARFAVGDRFRHARTAGLTHPALVGGRHRLETWLLERGVVAKPGAQGAFGAGWTDDDGGAWGLAVRIEDGDGEAAATATYELLSRIGAIDAGGWAPATVRGGGRSVGVRRPAASLLEVARLP